MRIYTSEYSQRTELFHIEMMQSMRRDSFRLSARVSGTLVSKARKQQCPHLCDLRSYFSACASVHQPVCHAVA